MPLMPMKIDAPFLQEASKDARPALQQAINEAIEALGKIRLLCATEGLYAAIGWLAIDDGNHSFVFASDGSIQICDTSDSIPF